MMCKLTLSQFTLLPLIYFFLYLNKLGFIENPSSPKLNSIYNITACKFNFYKVHSNPSSSQFYSSPTPFNNTHNSVFLNFISIYLSIFYIDPTKAMFGTAETRRKERMEKRKFIEKRVSIVWLLCKCGKKVSVWWGPRSKTFHSNQRRKLDMDSKIVKLQYCHYLNKKNSNRNCFFFQL